MFPIEYTTVRRRQEDMLRQAAHARLLRTVEVPQQNNWRLVQKPINWLGARMVNCGQKLEQFGARESLQPSPAPQQ